MPNIKAAEKWVRQSSKRTTQNLDTKTRLKTLFKKAAASQDPEAARLTESQLDKAAKRGVIHPNKAARKKSRLAKAMKTAATTVKPVKSTKAKSKSGSAAKTSKKTASK